MDKSVDSLPSGFVPSGFEPSVAEESIAHPTPLPVKEELIKINLPVFEAYLNSIKEQLGKHEKQLESPAWLDDLKRESDKIAALARRLEHTQVDVNTIKDYIYYPPTNGSKDKQRKDPMLLLQADVESLKLVARRIDLYQSEDLNVYVQLKKLQKDYYDLLKMIEKLDKDSVINAMKADFNNKITNMNNRIDEINETVEENRHTLDDKIEEVHQTVEMDMRDRIKDVQDQINAFLSDGEEGGDEAEGGSDRDPTETQDTFDEGLDNTDILKPSQMALLESPKSGGGRRTVRDSTSDAAEPGNRDSVVSFGGLGGFGGDVVRSMGTEENNTRRTTAVRKSSLSGAVPEDTDVRASGSDGNKASEEEMLGREVLPSAAAAAAAEEEQEEGEGEASPSGGRRRNTISNAVPGGAGGDKRTASGSPAKRSTLQGGGRASTASVAGFKMTAAASAASAPPRDTMMSLGGFSASGGGAGGQRKTTTKGGKFCTLDRFMLLVDEVNYLKHSLSMNVFKLRAHGVSRLQKVFTKLLGKEGLKSKRKAFAKFQLNMQFVREYQQKRYKVLTFKTDFIVERALGRLQVRDYFVRWKEQTERLVEGQRLYHYSHSIMKYWLGRVKPDIRKYLTIWKNFTVESFRKFVYNGLDDTEAPAYDEFQHMLNGNFNMKAMMKIAHKDLLRRMALREAKLKATTPQIAYVKDEEAERRVQESLDALSKRLEESDEENRVMRRDVLRLFALLEGNKADMTARIDREATLIMGTINNFKSKVTTQLTHTGDLIEMNQKRNDTQFSLHADISDALRVRIQDLEKELKFHEETQNSIINSQKSIREEMDELLMKQEYIDSKFKQVTNEIMLNAKAMAVGIEEVRRVEKEYRDITTYYDGELKSIKDHANTIESNLAQSIKNTEEKTDLLALKSDLLAANQDEVFPQKPQAYFVFRICQAYETVMLRIHNEGGVSLLNKSIEEDLAKIAEDMAIEATRIAHYVVTAADRIVSHRLMQRLVMEAASPANLEFENKPSNLTMTPAMTFAALGANNGVHNNHNTSVKNIPVSVQVVQEREALLNDFLSQYVNLMQERDPNPGVVRANARIVFHAKLKMTTEVLISKSHCMYSLLDVHQSALTKRQMGNDSAVVGATLGGVDSHETCMACNRPMSAVLPNGGGSGSGGGGGSGTGSGHNSRPPSALNRPSSATATASGGKSNQETAATIAQLQQQLAHITSSLNKMKLLDPLERSSPLRLTNGGSGTTGMLRPHSATVLGRRNDPVGMMHAAKDALAAVAAGSGHNAVTTAAAAVGNDNGGGGSSGGGVEHHQPRLKRAGTFHRSKSHGHNQEREEQEEDPALLEDLQMVDREHHTHMNTRRNSGSNMHYHLNESDFSRARTPEQQMTSSLSHSRSTSPPLGAGGSVTLANEHTLHHIDQDDPVTSSRVYEEEGEFDAEGFHQYLQKPYNLGKKSMPTSSGAVRHRDAVHKSHAMLLTTQGGGFKTSPALSQEEMILELTASFHADVSIPRDINQDRSDLLYTESENALREMQQHALSDEDGLRSALNEGYSGEGLHPKHLTGPSGMVLSQSDSHLLGSRRLVGTTNKGKKTANATINFN